MSIIRRTIFLSRDLFSGLRSPQRCVTQRLISSLSEVGKLEAIKIGGNYDTGQMFLHKVFGYRGVVLFPWLARVYDRDLPNKAGGAGTRDRLLDTENPNMGAVGKEVKGRTHTYYQVLIDGRDSPYITHRAQTESVTFLGNHSENTRCDVIKTILFSDRDLCCRNLYAIPGLDYVAHEDILPYSTSETNPLQHELFDKFLMYQEGREPPYTAQARVFPLSIDIFMSFILGYS